MKAKILMAALAFFAFTTIGMAQGTAKKAAAPAKKECCPAKTDCGTAKDDCATAKDDCGAAKTKKAPAAKTATASNKAVAKPTVKK